MVRDFGGMAGLKEAMRKAALGQFGSGWAWLSADGEGTWLSKSPQTRHTAAPDPLAVLRRMGALPTISNTRIAGADYFEAWWRLVDWPEVSRLYTGCLACRPPRP